MESNKPGVYFSPDEQVSSVPSFEEFVNRYPPECRDRITYDFYKSKMEFPNQYELRPMPGL